jgi:hypothetical protein
MTAACSSEMWPNIKQQGFKSYRIAVFNSRHILGDWDFIFRQ